MSKDFNRTQRVADVIQRILAQVILHEMQDPRVHLVTVTAVTISRDLSYAKVFITQMAEDNNNITATLKVLKKATPFLRHRLSQEIDLRIVPELNFVFDDSISNAAHLSKLIDKALSLDEVKQSDDEHDVEK